MPTETWPDDAPSIDDLLADFDDDVDPDVEAPGDPSDADVTDVPPWDDEPA